MLQWCYMDQSFFRGNRNRLTELLKGGIVVLNAYGRQQRSNDAAHAFTQEANFWYLTGIDEPDWGLVIDGSSARSYLIMPQVDDVHRIFDGRLSAEDAKRLSGVDKVITEDEAASLMMTLAKKHELAYTVGTPAYAEHFNFALNPSSAHHRQALDRRFARVQDIRKELAKMRAIKSPAEIDAMRKVINLTVGAFKHVNSRMSTYRFEYEIEADFSHFIRHAGAKGHAYDPIIAGGPNACTLHYSSNSDKLRTRQLVLMDVGAGMGGYAADITRTYAKGSPTKRQLEVHGAVERAHHKIIRTIEPMRSVEAYQKDVDDIMKTALTEAGLAHDEAGLRRYFPHAVSHGLGIDVHDSLGSPKRFEPGMVLTVEPGIYIPEEGIGVRIEDDILVTPSGHENLSGTLSTGL